MVQWKAIHPDDNLTLHAPRSASNYHRPQGKVSFLPFTGCDFFPAPCFALRRTKITTEAQRDALRFNYVLNEKGNENWKRMSVWVGEWLLCSVI